MSLIQKLIDAQDNQDLKAYNEVVSEDYYWVKHSTGEHVVNAAGSFCPEVGQMVGLKNNSLNYKNI